jgi:inorganic pyrophosphatase
MQTFYDSNPGAESPQTVRMIVEIPKDSSNKYEYRPALGLFELSRALYSPMHYPGDYGFIPGTLAEDNEPLDVLCLASIRSFTGCLVHVRPIAVLDMLDGPEVDHKIIAVPARDPRYTDVRQLSDIEPHVKRELEYFFQLYKDLEGRTMQTRAWGNREEAHRLINESRCRQQEAAETSAVHLSQR